MKPPFETLLDTALAAHDCQTGTLHLLDPATGLLTLAAHIGLPAHVAAIVATVPVGKGMAGLAAERGEPVQTCNLQTDATGDVRPGAKAVPVQASVAVPMWLDGRLRGVLGFARADFHEWSEAELTAMRATASDVARRLSTGH
jgi:L-methionine (R)-S-oxide reductase